MQLILTIVALISVAIGMLILFPPQSEIDRSIKEAMSFPANKEAMRKAINGDSK